MPGDNAEARGPSAPRVITTKPSMETLLVLWWWLRSFHDATKPDLFRLD